MVIAVIYYSYDPNNETYCFDEIEEAGEFIQKEWAQALATERKESTSGVDEDRSYFDEKMDEGFLFWDDESNDYMHFFISEAKDLRNILDVIGSN